MKLKNLRLKSSKYCGSSKEYSFDFSSAISTINHDDPSSCYDLSEFFILLSKYLLSNDFTSFDIDKNEELEFVLEFSLESNKENTYSYSLLISEGGYSYFSESLMINNILAIYADIEKVDIGPSYGKLPHICDDEEKLLMIYDNSKTIHCSTILKYINSICLSNSSINELTKIFTVDINEDVYYFHNVKAFLRYYRNLNQNSILDTTLNLLKFYFPDIIDIDFESSVVKYSGGNNEEIYTIPTENEGSGFKFLLYFIPLMESSLKRGEVLILTSISPFYCLHPMLRRNILRLYNNKINEEGKGQLIYFGESETL